MNAIAWAAGGRTAASGTQLRSGSTRDERALDAFGCDYPDLRETHVLRPFLRGVRSRLLGPELPRSTAIKTPNTTLTRRAGRRLPLRVRRVPTIVRSSNCSIGSCPARRESLGPPVDRLRRAASLVRLAEVTTQAQVLSGFVRAVSTSRPTGGWASYTGTTSDRQRMARRSTPALLQGCSAANAWRCWPRSRLSRHKKP